MNTNYFQCIDVKFITFLGLLIFVFFRYSSASFSLESTTLRTKRHFLFFFPVAGDVYNLFAFPSECNFSGMRFNLDLVNLIKEDANRVLEGSSHAR